jgi:rSAM/selenodomain-associated transferase 2
LKNIFCFSQLSLRYETPMISVVIPTLNAARTLQATFRSIFDATIEGLVSEVIVSDAGSSDATIEIAEAAGATIVASERGRGQQLRAGAMAARKQSLLFLHADTVLAAGWEEEAKAFIANPSAAASFRFKLADSGIGPRLLETFVALRCAIFRLPYGDQGLLISRTLYDAVGGFAPIPIMEDVDLVRKLGRKRIVMLTTPAITSAERFRKDGYLRRSMRNLRCLFHYYRGVPAEELVRLYG